MSSSSAPDPILLTLFANRFMSVAEAMGKSLRQVSFATPVTDELTQVMYTMQKNV